MRPFERMVREHGHVTRRYFLGTGAAGLAGVQLAGALDSPRDVPPALAEAVAGMEFLTRKEDFKYLPTREDPAPETFSPKKRRETGLDPETWELEVVPDPGSNAKLEHVMSKELGTALNWNGLMALAKTKAVRFISVMTCTNVAQPEGVGLWEGVPLRDVVWMARPVANVRRVFYSGYHNDDPKQLFQSSLTMSRVLEEPPGELPVILCYKMNGEWLTPKLGGPVRMIVPGSYGNKSIKWLQRVVLTNNYQLNDTYAGWNNDTESPMKTCARFAHVPEKARAGEALAVTGFAQVGLSGLSKVQYWICPKDAPLPADDPYFSAADWKDATILPPPEDWGGGLPGGKLPPVPLQIDPASGKPYEWPMRWAVAHWAALIDGLAPGRYLLRCRTIDGKGIAQPMPRPLPKTGHNKIQQVEIVVEA